MKLRCDIHLESGDLKVLLAPKPEEKLDHLALKLAGVVMFLGMSPVVEPSSDHPALHDYDVKPDVLAMDMTGAIKLWLECGEVSINKLDKISRRLGEAKIVVLKRTEHQAKQLRERIGDELRQSHRIQIWAWPAGEFDRWLAAMREKTEVFGEAHEKSFNLVVNDVPYAVDLIQV